MSFMPTPPEQPVLSVHPNKYIISLTGLDVRDFLNDILTASDQHPCQRHCRCCLPALTTRADPV